MTDARPLEHVPWIGGGTAAGKTSVARRLAEAHRLHCYECDREEHAQVRRVDPVRHPYLHRWLGMTMDERWVETAPEALAETTLRTQEEFFALILEDVERLSAPRLVVVEGFGSRPDLVAPLLPGPGHAVWLLPTPEFRAQALRGAGRAWGMPGQTSDPARALANRLERDRLLTDHTRHEAGRLGLPTVEVDGTRSLSDIAAAVEAQFAPVLRT